MKIHFNKLLSPINSINKKFRSELAPDLWASEDGFFVNECDSHDPEVVLAGVSSFPFSEYDYAYIPVFGAYYFIDKAAALTGSSADSFGQVLNRVRLSLHLDVLYTYRTQILAASGAIVRRASGTDRIPDKRDILAQRRETCVKTFPGQWSGQCPVLLIAGPPALPDAAAPAGVSNVERSVNNV